tara:strand:- start:140 stop:376 length:237 start_codon:yes stop_codon:yes gene_type:complete
MNNKVSYAGEVDITCTGNDKVVTAEIDNFRYQESLTAFIATNKIPMRWTGRVYVGNAHGMEFTTPGPKEVATPFTRRR